MQLLFFIRLLVTGGGHLEFPHEKKSGRKNGNIFFSVLLGQYK